MSQKCAICEVVDDGEFIQPKVIGINTINKASNERGDKLTLKVGDYVHKKCRKEYIHKWYIKTSISSKNEDTRRTRSTCPTFNFKENCLFCSSKITTREKLTKQVCYVESRFRELDKKILSEITNRNYDEWALLVYGRIEFVPDLHAADATYHRACHTNFCSGKSIPKKYDSSNTSQKRGRPINTKLDDAYEKVCLHLKEKEANDELVTIKELFQYMETLSPEDHYSPKHLKRKLLEDFDGRIMISNVNGKQDVVTFVTTAAFILDNFHDNQNKNIDSKRERMGLLKPLQKS